MKYIVYIFLLFPILVTAQTYKYIGIENGFIQDGETAEESFIPEFDNEGV